MMLKTIIFTLLVALTTFGVSAEPFHGKVVRVSDGDTITVFDGKSEIRVRLEGIDAPESMQPYGEKSRKALLDLTIGKMVEVKPSGFEEYGRTLGRVFTDSGKLNVNEEQVRCGWAWHYKQFNKDKDLAALETAARAARLGLWVDPKPTPPWNFRSMNAKAERN